jgi:hypothetical protein
MVFTLGLLAGVPTLEMGVAASRRGRPMGWTTQPRGGFRGRRRPFAGSSGSQMMGYGSRDFLEIRESQVATGANRELQVSS